MIFDANLQSPWNSIVVEKNRIPLLYNQSSETKKNSKMNFSHTDTTDFFSSCMQRKDRNNPDDIKAPKGYGAFPPRTGI